MSATAGPGSHALPSADALAEAKRLVSSMKAAARGPYKQLRWYCNDGSVHPPKPYPCESLGGGRQHAEYSAERERLAELGWSVGTIVAALSWDEFWDARGGQDRLRQLALEQYLRDVDGAWVLRKARDYRGHVQAEDEEAAGGLLLRRLLGDADFVRDEYLLAREVVRAVPHAGVGEDSSRLARRQSKELAELDASFETLRIRIHTNPRDPHLTATRQWLARAVERGAPPSVLGLARQLETTLEQLEGGRSLEQIVAQKARRRGAQPLPEDISRELRGLSTIPALERVDRLARAMLLMRESLGSNTSASQRLDLFDLSIPAEAELLGAAMTVLDGDQLDRRRALELARDLVDGVWGAGWLSRGEADDLRQRIDSALAQDPATVTRLSAAARQLERSAGWAQGTVQHAFSPALPRYTALEPKAGAFVDDLLRGSSMLALARVGRLLATDAQALSGVRTNAFGSAAAGLAGLNPGLSIGRLRVLSEADLAAGRSAGGDEIVVLPRTVSELEPVAGILSIDEGNVLSHVQLLARNLGIPNVAVSAALAPELTRRDGLEVLLAVAPDGSVVLEALSSVRERLPPDWLTTAAMRADVAPKVTAPQPQLGLRDPLPLEALSADLSGKVVGPKAANLGELARLFPGRVSAAIGLPFGFFAAHAADGPDSPKARLEAAFQSHRRGEIDAAELARSVEDVRVAVAGLRIRKDSRARLMQVMREQFGEPGTYGVFVRSDTNVEDLPGFTGAGLNLTIPHVVGLEAQLAAIPTVWSSPFRPRAMAWRERALANPEEVYPSVLLQRSVPADKSGVLVTTDLIGRREGLTVASAWGVGGAVDGESAETLVLLPEGRVELVSEAKAPWERRLPRSGGVEWSRARTGPILTSDEHQQLRLLAEEVRGRMEPARDAEGRPLPWDVEFGFVDGQLQLFQIRPLVERSAARAQRVVQALLGPAESPAGNASLSGRLIRSESPEAS